MNHQLRKNFEKKSTFDLRRIIAERDSGEWSDDAIGVAEELLRERPEPDEPFDDAPVKASKSIDRRGQSVFELTNSEIAAYRLKIQALGWAFCILGAFLSMVCLSPSIFGDVSSFPLGRIGFILLAIIPGMFIIFVGVDLIRLNPRSRIVGLVISFFLLLFFPVGTAIGICGILWLGKRGSVLNSVSNQETKLPNRVPGSD
jgi:hypothetical protein